MVSCYRAYHMVPHHLHRIKFLYRSQIMVIIEIMHLYMRFLPGTHWMYWPSQTLFFFFFLKILHSFLGSVIRLTACNQKAENEATTHDQIPCSYSVETVTPKCDIVISGNSCLLFLENRKLSLLVAQETN